MRHVPLLILISAAVLSSGLCAQARRTGFNPRVHGFKFTNNFTNNVISGLDIRTSGLCGGMSYAALDHYLAKRSIPQQDYVPAEHTPLRRFIYDRQVRSLTANADKWAELVVNPFGWRTSEFFNWGLQGFGGGRLQELRACIDRGVPAPLGLFAPGGGGISAPHHQVLAIGYDLGRYKGDLKNHKTDLKIFIYDPNYPGQTQTLVPDPKNSVFTYVGKPTKKYMTYFVDRKYRMVRPPRAAATSHPKDGKVHELVIEFRTGGDDLRGGRDNLDVSIVFKNGPTQRVRNINRGKRWISNNAHFVSVRLARPIAANDILWLDLQTTSRGGLSGDNWNLDRISVRALGGNLDRTLATLSGKPFNRFTGQRPRLRVPINAGQPAARGTAVNRRTVKPATPRTQAKPRGRSISKRPNRGITMAGKAQVILTVGTGDDDLRGGRDNLDVVVLLLDGRRHTFRNINRGRRLANRSRRVFTLDLPKGLAAATVKGVELRTTSGGGIGGDNWDLVSLEVRAKAPGTNRVVYTGGTRRLHRFTGTRRSFRTCR